MHRLSVTLLALVGCGPGLPTSDTATSATSDTATNDTDGWAAEPCGEQLVCDVGVCVPSVLFKSGECPAPYCCAQPCKTDQDCDGYPSEVCTTAGDVSSFCREG